MHYLLDSIAIWHWYKKALLMIFIGFLLILFCSLFDIMPLYKKVQLSKQSLNTALMTFQKDSFKSKKLAFYQKLSLKRQQELQSQILLLSSKIHVANIIQKISMTANQNNLQLLMIKPKTKIIQYNHTLLPIEINIQGSFHDIEQFLKQLFKQKPIIILNNFFIYMINDDSNKKFQNKLDINMSLYVYQTKS